MNVRFLSSVPEPRCLWFRQQCVVERLDFLVAAVLELLLVEMMHLQKSIGKRKQLVFR